MRQVSGDVRVTFTSKLNRVESPYRSPVVVSELAGMVFFKLAKLGHSARMRT